MGHLVNPIGIRLNYSLTWSDSWSASNRIHYLNHYNNIFLVKTYLNYFFSKDYIENYGIFFSHFSVSWNSARFLIEINLYDGRVEDWIETCSSLLSQDLKRLAAYSLKTFKLNYKGVEFARSMDYDFFYFLTTLLLKLIFKLDIDSFKQLSVSENTTLFKNSYLLLNVADFLIKQNKEENLVLRKSLNLLKFFLRVFCLISYQVPLYTSLMRELKIDLLSITKLQPKIMIFGCENKNVTSIFISRYLSRKLAQKYKWTELMASLKKDLNYMTDTEKFLYGYKIQFHGRFTRRSRSEAVSSGYGRVSTSTISANIDYASSNLTLRNGSGSVKVWLYRAPRFKIFSYKVL